MATDPRTTFMADQLQAEFMEQAEKLLEEALHQVGMCSADFPPEALSLINTALMTGSTATIQVLMRHRKIRTEAPDGTA